MYHINQHLKDINQASAELSKVICESKHLLASDINTVWAVLARARKAEMALEALGIVIGDDNA